MKIFERRLVKSNAIVKGYFVIRRSIIINDDTYTLEFNWGKASFFKNKEIIAEDREAYIEFEKATGIPINKFELYLEKIKLSRFKSCCRKKAGWTSGHPGEYYLICPVCEQILDVDIRLGEIM